MDLGLRDRAYLVTGGSRGSWFRRCPGTGRRGSKRARRVPSTQATASAAADRRSQSSTAANTPTWIVADNADPDLPSRLIAAARQKLWPGRWGTLERGRNTDGERREHHRRCMACRLRKRLPRGHPLRAPACRRAGDRGHRVIRPGRAHLSYSCWLRRYADRCRISPSPMVSSPDSRAS